MEKKHEREHNRLQYISSGTPVVNSLLSNHWHKNRQFADIDIDNIKSLIRKLYVHGNNFFPQQPIRILAFKYACA